MTRECRSIANHCQEIREIAREDAKLSGRLESPLNLGAHQCFPRWTVLLSPIDKDLRSDLRRIVSVPSPSLTDRKHWT